MSARSAENRLKQASSGEKRIKQTKNGQNAFDAERTGSAGALRHLLFGGFSGKTGRQKDTQNFPGNMP